MSLHVLAMLLLQHQMLLALTAASLKGAAVPYTVLRALGTLAELLPRQAVPSALHRE